MNGKPSLIIPFSLALLLHALAGTWLVLGLKSHERLTAPVAEVVVQLQAPAVIIPPEPPKAKPSPQQKPAAKPPPQPTPAPLPVLASKEPTPASPVAPAPVPPPRPAPPAVPEPVSTPRFDAAYLNNPKPAYPMLARRNGDEGKVLLRVHVSAEGHAQEVQVQTGSGSPALDRAAREAVLSWRFVPARQGAQAVAAWVLVPIVFKLDD